MDEPSALLLNRWRQGDQDAATALFHRYAERLIALARSRLPDQLAPYLGGEDVVQSVFNSFFRASREGRYQLQRPGDLWGLLVAITLHKLHDQVARQATQKRGGDQRIGPFGLQVDPLGGDPTPAEATALADELDQVLSALDPRHRQIMELWLQGQGWDEISAAVGFSQRTVRRVLEKIEAELKQRLQENGVD